MLNDEDNFISMAILDAYKYRTNRANIPVSKHLIENVKNGSMPTQRIGINYSPSTYYLNSHLLEFNDKSGRHPLSKLRKSDLSNSQRKYVLNYHANNADKIAANKNIDDRVLLNNYNPDTQKYELKCNEDDLYSIHSKADSKIPLQLFDQSDLETLAFGNLFDAENHGKAKEEINGFARYYKNEEFIWSALYFYIFSKFLFFFIMLSIGMNARY